MFDRKWDENKNDTGNKSNPTQVRSMKVFTSTKRKSDDIINEIERLLSSRFYVSKTEREMAKPGTKTKQFTIKWFVEEGK